MTPPDRTADAVAKQLAAMQTDIFEIGIFNAEKEAMLLKNWDTSTVMRSIGYLKYQNMQGHHIYVRPRAEYMNQLSGRLVGTEPDKQLESDPMKMTHRLTLVDDLTADIIARMKTDGFNPALITETSPGNFQAWLNHGQVLPAAISTEAARQLAATYSGDPGSADWRHFGRLAGFTNCKKKHQLENGRYPFVLLHEANGAEYSEAKTFIASVEKQHEERAQEEKQRREAFKDYQPTGEARKTIHDFRNDPKYHGDYHRADLGYATYALSRGVKLEDVEAAIRTRDLSHKGSDKNQQSYIDRTIAKATENIQANAPVRKPSRGIV